MDFHLGRLVDYLKAREQYDNTIIIFTSDNGADSLRDCLQRAGPGDTITFDPTEQT